MASVFRESSGKSRLQVLINGERKSYALGKINKKQADFIEAKVDELEVAKKINMGMSSETLAWIKNIDPEFFEKLSLWGLVPASVSGRLSRDIDIEKLFEDCQAQLRQKPNTKMNWRLAKQRAIRYLGKSKPIQSVTAADAKGLRHWMLTTGWNGKAYAEGTTRKTTGILKQVFDHAIAREWISKNPFRGKDLPTAVRANKSRQAYISAETVLNVMSFCSCNERKLIIALTRFNGLRCPSEHLGLRKRDIDWQRRRMLIHSPKTEHHPGKATRIIPIMPEVYGLLEKLCDRLQPDDFVVTLYRMPNSGQRKMLIRAIKQAKTTQWPRLFHNMRSSCQTDWERRFPSHVVCQWMGNSYRVATEHYLQVTEEDFEAATMRAQSVQSTPVIHRERTPVIETRPVNAEQLHKTTMDGQG